MPRVEAFVLIRARRDVVMAVAQDNESFPQFMEDVDSVTVLHRSDDKTVVNSEWVAIVPKFNRKITWIEEDTWDVTRGLLTFRQVSGDYDEFHGTWSFTEPEAGITRFESVLNYRLEIPLVGPLIKGIIQKAMQNNVDATLAAIKKRCESGS